MQIDFIDTGYFKLDGGAMFGVVPRVMWEKANKPDENNLCTWAGRCMLIRHEGKVILIDTGMGDKQDAKFRSHFHPHGEKTLLSSLSELGVKPEDVTDVILTHLHFDHVGGATYRNAEGQIVTTFPNATYYSNEKHWAWARNPNAKESASFLEENLLPLYNSGQLEMLPIDGKKDFLFNSRISLRPLFGHTDAMMMPLIENDKGKRIAYCADLIPSVAHISMPWILAYDIRPLDTLAEKKRLLDDAVDEKMLLAFEHDPKIDLATVIKNERGRFKPVIDGAKDYLR